MPERTEAVNWQRGFDGWEWDVSSPGANAVGRGGPKAVDRGGGEEFGCVWELEHILRRVLRARDGRQRHTWYCVQATD